MHAEKQVESYMVANRVHPRTDLALLEKWITKIQLAQVLGVSVSFINKLMSEEGLPHLKAGRAVRFRYSDVIAWFQKKGLAP